MPFGFISVLGPRKYISFAISQFFFFFVCLYLCRLYLKGKYNSESWLQSEKISVKDALKVLVLDPLKVSLVSLCSVLSIFLVFAYVSIAWYFIEHKLPNM